MVFFHFSKQMYEGAERKLEEETKKWPALVPAVFYGFLLSERGRKRRQQKEVIETTQSESWSRKEFLAEENGINYFKRRLLFITTFRNFSCRFIGRKPNWLANLINIDPFHSFDISSVSKSFFYDLSQMFVNHQQTSMNH